MSKNPRLKSKINKFYLEALFPNFYKIYNRELLSGGIVPGADMKDDMDRKAFKDWLNPNPSWPGDFRFWIDPEDLKSDNPYIKTIASYELPELLPDDEYALMLLDPNPNIRVRAEGTKRPKAKKPKKIKPTIVPDVKEKI